MSLVLAYFLGKFGCYTDFLFAEVFCVMYAGEKSFTEIKKLKAVFNVLVDLKCTFVITRCPASVRR